MIKEKESTIDRLERTAVSHGIRVRHMFVCVPLLCASILLIPFPFLQYIQKMVEACARAIRWGRKTSSSEIRPGSLAGSWSRSRVRERRPRLIL